MITRAQIEKLGALHAVEPTMPGRGGPLVSSGWDFSPWDVICLARRFFRHDRA